MFRLCVGHVFVWASASSIAQIQFIYFYRTATTLDNIDDTSSGGNSSSKFSLLGGDMQRRFDLLQDQLKRKPSRASRLAFLGSLLLDNNKVSLITRTCTISTRVG